LSTQNIKNLIKLGSSTAKSGFQNEEDVVNKFNSWKSDQDAQAWLKIMNYKIDEIEKIEAVKVKGSFKTDVQVKISIFLKKLIYAENISVKLVSNLKGFNQIDKRWIKKYQELWLIPNEIAVILQKYTGEISPIDSGVIRDQRRLYLDEFSENERKKLLKFFEENRIIILNDIFKGRDNLAASWMLIYLKPKNTWSLLPIGVVMNFYGLGEITITERGNLRIGRITVQRKGGDGGRPSANMLQFKIDPAEILLHTNTKNEKFDSKNF
jgi:hypothetical protein